MCLAALGVHTSSASETIEVSREHLELRQKAYDSCAASGHIPLQVQYDRAMGIATMAMAYNTAGEFERAVLFAEQALQEYKSFELYRNWKTIPYFAVAHAGWAYWSLGRYEEAADVLLEAISADRRKAAAGSYG